MNHKLFALIVSLCACSAASGQMPANSMLPCFTITNVDLIFLLSPFRADWRHDLSTNWTTISSEPLANGYTRCRQAGQVISNNFAVLMWNGSEKRVELDSVPLTLDVLPQRVFTNNIYFITR